jgi:hypothetical protein
MVTMIALPPFASELVALLIGAVVALLVIRRRPVRLYDVEREIAYVTDKVRHPWTYKLRTWAKGE